MAKARKRKKPTVNPEDARQTKKFFLITAVIVVVLVVLLLTLYTRS